MFLFQWKGFVSYGAIIFAMIGICYAIINGVPLKFQIANDGYNVMTMIKDPNARTAFYVQLKVNALLNEGKSYRQLPKELITMSKDVDLRDSLMASQKLMEYYYYLEQLDFHMAEEIIEELVPVLDTLPEVIKYYVTIEKLFLCYLQGKSEEEINKYNTSQFQGFIKKLNYELSIKRLKYAELMWENAWENEFDNALDEYKRAKEKFPIKGEIIMNDTLMNYLEGKKREV